MKKQFFYTLKAILLLIAFNIISSEKMYADTYDRCFKGSNVDEGRAQLLGIMPIVYQLWSPGLVVNNTLSPVLDRIGNNLLTYRLCEKDGTPLVINHAKVRYAINHGHVRYVNGTYVNDRWHIPTKTWGSETVTLSGDVGILFFTWDYYLNDNNEVVYDPRDYAIMKVSKGLSVNGEACCNPGIMSVPADVRVKTETITNTVVEKVSEPYAVHDTTYVYVETPGPERIIYQESYVGSQMVAVASIGFYAGVQFTPYQAPMPVSMSYYNNSTYTNISHNTTIINYCQQHNGCTPTTTGTGGPGHTNGGGTPTGGHGTHTNGGVVTDNASAGQNTGRNNSFNPDPRPMNPKGSFSSGPRRGGNSTNSGNDFAMADVAPKGGNESPRANTGPSRPTKGNDGSVTPKTNTQNYSEPRPRNNTSDIRPSSNTNSRFENRPVNNREVQARQNTPAPRQQTMARGNGGGNRGGGGAHSGGPGR